MIKAAPKLFCLIFLAVSPALKAQTGPGDPVAIATDVAIRREADTVTLRKKLALAQSARLRNDLAGAAKLYQDCYQLTEKIGAEPVQLEREQTVAGLSYVLMQLANQAQNQQNYREADKDVTLVLAADPQNQMALEFRRKNKALLDAQAGTIPSIEQLDRIPDLRSNEVRVATMVQDGKFLFEAGKIDEAEVKLNKALEEDPQNVAAYHYLQLITEQRNSDAMRRTEDSSRKALLKVEKAWDVEKRNGEMVPRPNPFNRSDKIYTGKGRQNIIAKLDSIKIESLKYDGLPLAEVINDLADRAKKRDPDGQGINFFINREVPTSTLSLGTGPGGNPNGIDPATGLPFAAAAPAQAVDVAGITVKVSLNNVRLADVLDAITLTAESPIKYSILDYAVVFSQKGPEATPLEIRTFHVDPNTFEQGLQSVTGPSAKKPPHKIGRAHV